MKIKRFTAKNMREAIRQVREEQGPDAVILSNRRTPDGIEVVAATDYDAALVQQTLRSDTRTQIIQVPPPGNKAAPIAARAAAPKGAIPALASIVTPLHEKILKAPVLSTPTSAAEKSWEEAMAVVAAVEAVTAPVAVAVTPAPETATVAVAAIATPQQIVISAPTATEDSRYDQIKRDLSDEIRGMRSMLENQLNGLAFDQMRSTQPKRMSVLRSLIDLSIAPALAREIIAELPEDASEARSRFLPMGALARRIPTTKNDVILDGGVIALVGATGVGKTTTIAKLAARFAAQHGTRDLALVTTDTYRVGAQEQLHTYGRLIGVPVHTVNDGDQLDSTLRRLADRKLVLIDTAGLAPRDTKLDAQLQTLARSGKIRNYLVLAANSQAGDLDEAARAFGATPLAGCILTKLDEATRIGGALSTVIRRQLPVAYFCDGQRVPEDLHPARPYHLVVRAQQLVLKIPACVDDAALALQFGAAHASA